jgi:hypothetical protein
MGQVNLDLQADVRSMRALTVPARSAGLAMHDHQFRNSAIAWVAVSLFAGDAVEGDASGLTRLAAARVGVS